jgi:hypothetical protein
MWIISKSHREIFFLIFLQSIHPVDMNGPTWKTLSNECKTFFPTVHRGTFCQFPFRWIYYYGSNKSNGKEAGKKHLCVLQWTAKYYFKISPQKQIKKCKLTTIFMAIHIFITCWQTLALYSQMCLANTKRKRKCINIFAFKASLILSETFTDFL